MAVLLVVGCGQEDPPPDTSPGDEAGLDEDQPEAEGVPDDDTAAEEARPPQVTLEDLGLSAQQIAELDTDRYDRNLQHLLGLWPPFEQEHDVFYAELAQELGEEAVAETAEEDWIRHPDGALVKPVYTHREGDVLTVGVAFRKAFEGATVCLSELVLEDDHGTTYVDTRLLAGASHAGRATDIWFHAPVGWTLVHEHHVEIPEAAPIVDASLRLADDVNLACRESTRNVPDVAVALPLVDDGLDTSAQIDVHAWMTTHLSDWVLEPGQTLTVGKPYLELSLERVVGYDVSDFGTVPVLAGTLANDDYNERELQLGMRPLTDDGRMDSPHLMSGFVSEELPHCEPRTSVLDCGDYEGGAMSSIRPIRLEPEGEHSFYASVHPEGETAMTEQIDGFVVWWGVDGRPTDDVVLHYVPLPDELPAP